MGTVVALSRSLLESGPPAWQRWQAVRAVECYRDFVLEKTEPVLSHIVLTLAKLGKQGPETCSVPRELCSREPLLGTLSTAS